MATKTMRLCGAVGVAAAVTHAACARHEDGERTTAQTTRTALVTYADLETELGDDTFSPSDILLDPGGAAFLVVGTDVSSRPSLRRCTNDGAHCTGVALDAGRGIHSAQAPPSAVVDPFGQKLLVVARDGALTNDTVSGADTRERAALYRCDLDGANCSWRDISSGVLMNTSRHGGPGAPSRATGLIDVRDQKLIVTECARSNEPDRRPIVSRCALDGSGCIHTDLATVAGPASCTKWFGSAIDAASNSVLMVSSREAAPGAQRLSLVRCNTDVTGCTQRDLDSPSSAQTYVWAALVDDVDRKLLVLLDRTGAPNDNPLELVRCELDGSGCTDHVLPFASPLPSARATIAGHELVIAKPGPSGAVLARCALDGATCTTTDLALPAPPAELFPFYEPPIALDSGSSSVLVATPMLGNNSAPGDFRRAPFAFRQLLDDIPPSRMDVSAGLRLNRYRGSGALDESRDAVLLIADAGSAGRILMRCDVRGGGCTSQPAPGAKAVVGVADDVLVMLAGADNGTTRELLRCAPDGNACTHTPLASGDAIALDGANRQIVVLRAGSTGNATLSRCSLHGTDCTQGPELPFSMTKVFSVVPDPIQGRLLVLDLSAEGRLWSCAADGTSCKAHALAPPSSVNSAALTQVVADGNAAYVTTFFRDGSAEQLTFFQCPIDGDSCTNAKLSLGAGPHAIAEYSAAVDTVSNKLRVVTNDVRRLDKPTLVTCELDGSACIAADISAGQPPGSGTVPTALFSVRRNSLLVLTRNESNLGRPSLFAVDLSSGEPPPEQLDAGSSGSAGTDSGGSSEGTAVDLSTGEPPPEQPGAGSSGSGGTDSVGSSEGTGEAEAAVRTAERVSPASASACGVASRSAKGRDARAALVAALAGIVSAFVRRRVRA